VTRPSTLRAVLWGVLLGVALVAAVVALVATGILKPPRSAAQGSTSGPVLVALVLPDEAGGRSVRALDLYLPSSAGPVVRSQDPSAGVTVAGTSAATLSDAYVYGGGAGLVTAYEGLTGTRPTGWIVIDPASWRTLAADRTMHVRFQATMDVYEAARLYSYSADTTRVPALEAAKIMDGAAWIDASARASLRRQLGDFLGTTLSSAPAPVVQGVETDLNAADLARWLPTLALARRADGS
jgi:hypothetical protein